MVERGGKVKRVEQGARVTSLPCVPLQLQSMVQPWRIATVGQTDPSRQRVELLRRDDKMNVMSRQEISPPADLRGLEEPRHKRQVQLAIFVARKASAR